MKIMLYIFILISCIQTWSVLAKDNETLTKPFIDYVNEEESHYTWFYTGKFFTTEHFGTAYVLNVTSLKWFDDKMYKV